MAIIIYVMPILTNQLAKYQHYCPYFFKLYQFIFSPESEQNFNAFRSKRDTSLSNLGGLQKINPWSQPTFWDYFPPTISCPFPLSRLGSVGEGGKFICGLTQISKKSQPPCLLYSFGVGGDSSFESDILERTPCSV
jgi:hypothetical protein